MLPVELLNICRLCLVREHVNVHIFESNTTETSHKISSCLPVSIRSDDQLPQKICDDCCNKVNLFYEFRRQTLDSEKHLQSWLSEHLNISENFNKYPIHYTNIEEANDDSIDGLQSQEDSDSDTDVKHVLDPKGTVNITGQSNQIYSVNYQDEKLEGSVFQGENASALKQLQGYTDELTHNTFSNLSKIFQVLHSSDETIDSSDTTLSVGEETKPKTIELADTESPYRCNLCYKSFSCEDILAMHKLSQCNNDSVVSTKCYICDESFSNSLLLSQHLNTVHDDRKFHCEECGKCFSTKHHLRMHSSMHLDSKPFTCQKCGTAFRYKKTYETHIKIHINEKAPSDEQTFVCDICEQRFSTRNSYIHHARSHKNSSNKCKLLCTTCNQTFASKRMLAQHLRTQCSEETYSCEICGKELLTKESLECHKLIHNDEKSLVCKTCGKTFSHRKYFVVHQRIHTGERPFKCITCNKTFTQASTLTVHRRYHTGERPYKCFICSKGFVTRTIMLSHLKYHKESE